MTEYIYNIIHRNKFLYKKIIDNALSWVIKNSDSNCNKKYNVRTMLNQILSELSLKDGEILLKKLYNSSYDSSVVNLIYNRCKYFDVLSNDKQTSVNSIKIVIDVAKHLNLNISSYNNKQLAGLSIYFQLILMGLRSDFEGFGAEDLIKNSLKRMKKEKLEEVNKQKNANDLLLKEMIKISIKSSEDDEDDEEKKEDKIINENVLDNWENDI